MLNAERFECSYTRLSIIFFLLLSFFNVILLCWLFLCFFFVYSFSYFFLLLCGISSRLFKVRNSENGTETVIASGGLQKRFLFLFCVFRLLKINNWDDLKRKDERMLAAGERCLVGSIIITMEKRHCVCKRAERIVQIIVIIYAKIFVIVCVFITNVIMDFVKVHRFT